MHFDELTVREIKGAFRPRADDQKAAGAFAYMKGIAPFLGISAPDRKAILKPIFRELSAPTSAELGEAARLLFAQKEREYAYAGSALIRHFHKCADKYFLRDHVQDLITTKSWWDTVDSLGSDAVSPLSWKYPSRSLMKEWIASSNIWLNRAAIGHQRGRKAETDVDFVLWICHQKASHPEFFIQKAIGWALRDMAAFNKPAVRQFLAENAELTRVATREAERGLAR